MKRAIALLLAVLVILSIVFPASALEYRAKVKKRAPVYNSKGSVICYLKAGATPVIINQKSRTIKVKDKNGKKVQKVKCWMVGIAYQGCSFSGFIPRTHTKRIIY